MVKTPQVNMQQVYFDTLLIYDTRALNIGTLVRRSYPQYGWSKVYEFRCWCGVGTYGRFYYFCVWITRAHTPDNTLIETYGWRY